MVFGGHHVAISRRRSLRLVKFSWIPNTFQGVSPNDISLVRPALRSGVAP